MRNDFARDIRRLDDVNYLRLPVKLGDVDVEFCQSACARACAYARANALSAMHGRATAAAAAKRVVKAHAANVAPRQEGGGAVDTVA